MSKSEKIDKNFNPNLVSETYAEDFAGIIQLGLADQRFSRQTTVVELLIVLPLVLDSAGVGLALCECLKDSFQCLSGRKHDFIIYPGEGVRVSSIIVTEDILLTQPPGGHLFETLLDGELFTLRISSVHNDVNSISALGISFDHALTDISGIALFLRYLSIKYARGDIISLPTVHLDRNVQLHVVNSSTNYNFESTKTHVMILDSYSAQDVDDKNHLTKRSHKAKKVGGGVVCLEWIYSGKYINDLKRQISAYSRHDTIFADVISLVRNTNILPIETCSISRDDRIRCAEVPRGHFGNATNVVHFSVPSPTLEEKDDCVDEEDTTFVDSVRLTSSSKELVIMSQIALAIRTAIDGPAAPFDHPHCSLHLNTWWHSLQYPLFGSTYSDLKYAIGPRTLYSAGRLCASRGGQPNVTILPSNNGNFLVTLIAPLSVAHGVKQQLLQRVQYFQRRRVFPVKSLTPTTESLDSNPVGSSDESKQSDANTKKNENIFDFEPKESKVKKSELISERVRCGEEKATVCSRNTACIDNSAVLIWLHGLGNTSWVSWEKHFGGLDITGQKLQLLFPTALELPVSAQNGSVCASWFDIKIIPVSTKEWQILPLEQNCGLSLSAPPEGLLASISRIHTLIDSLVVTQGISTGRILIGGFSQGGATAMAAGLSYPKALAGIVSVSGWWPAGPERNGREGLVDVCKTSPMSLTTDDIDISGNLSEKSHNQRLSPPVFMSYGTSDPVVETELVEESISILRNGRTGRKHTETSTLSIHPISRKKHMPVHTEINLVKDFILSCLK